nr:putative ABC transporter ATP-binding protein MG065 [Lytechinus pictus]
MSGIDQSDTGDVFIKQKNLTLLNDSALTKFRKDHIGLIFQQYNLLKNLSALENVQIGSNLAPENKEIIPIDEVLKLLEIDHIADSYITELSGGEQQRFSIARGLVKNPDILFCDEPTGALDHNMSKKVLKMLQDINEKYNTTIVLITHNENFTKIADLVIRFSDGKVASSVQNEEKISALKL